MLSTLYLYQNHQNLRYFGFKLMADWVALRTELASYCSLGHDKDCTPGVRESIVESMWKRWRIYITCAKLLPLRRTGRLAPVWHALYMKHSVSRSLFPQLLSRRCVNNSSSRTAVNCCIQLIDIIGSMWCQVLNLKSRGSDSFRDIVSHTTTLSLY